MDRLDPTKKQEHEGIHVQAKQKQEYKFIGSSTRPHAGMHLYALDRDKEEIYKVEIVSEMVLDIKDKKMKKKNRADINPEHIMTWAINLKNATRKFYKMKFRV